jgi:hypothetical protein
VREDTTTMEVRGREERRKERVEPIQIESASLPLSFEPEVEFRGGVSRKRQKEGDPCNHEPPC